MNFFHLHFSGLLKLGTEKLNLYLYFIESRLP